MKLYKTKSVVILEVEQKFFRVKQDWQSLILQEDLLGHMENELPGLSREPNAEYLIKNELLPPIGEQEIWASGVTYFKSRDARMEEAKESGGGNFYDRVYEADRPELFMKSLAHRTVGHGQGVRIRKDATWNVPEPELTLVISPQGKIQGYTIGNDMSSRDIEGANPLYLPQAKTYDKSAAIGPCIYLTNGELPPSTQINIAIHRRNQEVFSGSTEISQMKRKLKDLVHYLYLELTFPNGCLLMTGTGIVPPNDFTLEINDEISITIEPIGTLTNRVE